MKNLFLTLLGVGFVAMLSAQTLSIKRQGKSADFSASDLLRIRTADPRKSPKTDFDALEVTGYFASETADSIRLKAKFIRQHTHKGELHTLAEQSYRPKGSQFAYFSIAKKDVFDLQNYQSYKKEKSKSKVAKIGAVLMATGLITLAHTALVDGRDNRRNLLISGGVQTGAGLVMAISATSKRYKFKEAEGRRNWRFN